MFILLLLVHAWSHSSPPGCTAALVRLCICVKLLSSVISVLAGLDLLFRDKSLCIFLFFFSHLHESTQLQEREPDCISQASAAESRCLNAAQLHPDFSFPQDAEARNVISGGEHL